MTHRDARRLRTQIARECARLIVDEGLTDFRTARRKVAQRLAITDRALLPDHQDIEQALLDYQQLFQADQQAQRLRRLREAALEAMAFLQAFRPRLTGAVLSGTAGPHTAIQLHLFAETPEEVALFLLEQDIPFATAERRLRLGCGGPVSLPVFRFSGGDHEFDLTVFALQAEREAPRRLADGRPLRRAGPADIRALLADAPP